MQTLLDVPFEGQKLPASKATVILSLKECKSAMKDLLNEKVSLRITSAPTAFGQPESSKWQEITHSPVTTFRPPPILRHLQRPKNSDFIIEVEQKLFPVHSIVLKSMNTNSLKFDSLCS